MLFINGLFISGLFVAVSSAVVNLCRHLGDYLLRQNIERLFGHNNGVELASANAVHQRTGFDKVVARERKQNALWRPIDRVATTTHSLQKCRNAFR